MNRIFEELSQSVVFAPQAVATATLKTTDFVDMSQNDEVCFLLATGALASGKKLTVQVFANDAASVANAEKVAEAEFVAQAAMDCAAAVVSCRPRAEHGRYLCLKFKHDAGADVVCAVTAAGKVGFRPAGKGWTLVV